MKFIRQWLTLLIVAAITLPAFASIETFKKAKQYQQGLFSFYTDTSTAKVYLEINEFNQPFLFQSSMPHGIGSNDIGLDRGQLGDTRLVQFERVGDKVFLRQLNTYYRANSQNIQEQQAVEQAFASSIIWGFKVVEASKDNQQVIVDYTPFLLSDIHDVAGTLSDAKQGNFKIDKSRSGLYAPRTKSFPKNTEFEAIITFTGSNAGNYLRSVTPDSKAVTVNFHHSLIALPDDEYQPRKFHPYSGYWSVSFADYATAIDEPLVQRVIPRHRLKKRDPEAEVSEPEKPIIYYLDTGAPEPIRTALLEGARWWSKAFEQIGYKNAFQVKMLPEGADPMDVRYNVIQWVHRATRGWSYGSSVIDPRTGEIIKGHVTLGSLRVRQDYLIALGLTSPFADGNADTSVQQEMALARIRQLSAHEVGHTLGIAHNFSSSVNARASVMDYPHPHIKMVDDKIDLSDAYDNDIGAWDKFVIAFGYSDIELAAEQNYLDNLVQEAQNAGLYYMSDPDARPNSSPNALAHLWDNGENAAVELERILHVREKALEKFGIDSIAIGTPLSELEQSLVPIFYLHRFQTEAAAKLIAGSYYSYELKTDEIPTGVSSVSGELQLKALEALLKTLSLDTLTLSDELASLIPPKAYGYYRTRESFASNTGISFDPVTAAEAAISHTLKLLLNDERLARLAQQSAVGKDIPSVEKLLTDLLEATVKQPSAKGLRLLVQHRLNKQVVEQLIELWLSADTVVEVRADVYVTLLEMSEWLDKRKKSRQYAGQRAQFRLLKVMIDNALEQIETKTKGVEVAMPPGSPIG